MIQTLPYDEVRIDRDVELKGILNTSNDSHFGNFVECELTCPDQIGERTKLFPFCPEQKNLVPKKI